MQADNWIIFRIFATLMYDSWKNEEHWNVNWCLYIIILQYL